MSTPVLARERYWSFSAGRKLDTCEWMWSARHGPDKLTDDQVADDDAAFVLRLRGNVVHDAIAAALIAAGVELATAHRKQPLPGTPLTRYRRAARIELGAAWERYEMPSDPDEALTCTEMLYYALDAVRVPARGALVGVELRRDTVTARGLPVRYVIDYAYRTPDGRLRIVDWKTGADDPERVGSNAQLLCYAVWLAADLGIDLRLVDIELHSLKRRRTVAVPVDIARAHRAVAELEDAAFAVEARVAAGQPMRTTTGSACVTCFARRACPTMAHHYASPDQV